jgi:hypothetical protein
MNVELSNGKEVRGVNGARGLEGAAYDFNSGPGRGHLHVTLGVKTKFLCSNRPLTLDEINEAETLLENAYREMESRRQELRDKLLGQDGDKFLAYRQGAVADGNTAPRDIRDAVFDGSDRNNNIKWAEVKERIRLLRESASTR